jgi:S1-C subfamily serine protease
MFRLLAGSVALLLVAGAARPAPDDEKKADTEVKVAAGKEVALTPAEVTIDAEPDEGRFGVKVKAKEAAKAKMPAVRYALGFTGEPVKGGGIKVVELPAGSGLLKMRPAALSADEGWEAETGDVITHANGYAVNTLEELVCAVSLAKDKGDVQLVVKDAGNGKPYVFYVTAARQ